MSYSVIMSLWESESLFIKICSYTDIPSYFKYYIFFWILYWGLALNFSKPSLRLKKYTLQKKY